MRPGASAPDRDAQNATNGLFRNTQHLSALRAEEAALNPLRPKASSGATPNATPPEVAQTQTAGQF